MGRGAMMLLLEILFLSGLWILLTGGSWDSWLVGVPAVVCAVMAIRFLGRVPSFRWRWWGVLQFCGYFVSQSILSGVDVAWRSVQFRPSLNPGWVQFSFRLSGEVARIFFVNVISLLPGTLSADLQDNGVLVHVIDENLPNRKSLRELENRVAILFGETVTDE